MVEQKKYKGGKCSFGGREAKYTKYKKQSENLRGGGFTPSSLSCGAGVTDPKLPLVSGD